MSRKRDKVNLGLIQMRCDEDPKKNLDRAVSRIVEAARDGAEIVCLQELFLSRYFCQTNDPKFFELAESVPGPTTELLSKIAKENKIVIVGSLFEKEGDKHFNTAGVIDADGTFLGKYRKLHIPDDLKNFYSEKFYFSPGDLGLPVFKTKYGKIGVQVCWDQWFPEGARQLALQGAEMIFYPTAIGWPSKKGDQRLNNSGLRSEVCGLRSAVNSAKDLNQVEFDAWLTIQRGHAIANTVFVAACNRTGPEGNLDFWGSSFVADPFGKVLGQAPTDKEENLIVTCDLNRIDAARKDWPFLDCRRGDVY